ncbi:hypothetical protein HanRHA438_Chr09g0428391 [Helianthus annuus]|nr:hypothetical protein HanRHA438_Chr09g0428391 [Helianthus annuus]
MSFITSSSTGSPLPSSALAFCLSLAGRLYAIARLLNHVFLQLASSNLIAEMQLYKPFLCNILVIGLVCRHPTTTSNGRWILLIAVYRYIHQSMLLELCNEIRVPLFHLFIYDMTQNYGGFSPFFRLFVAKEK